MKQQMFAKVYASIAKELLASDATTDYLMCLAKALRLDPECPEAAALLSEPKAPAKVRSPKRKRPVEHLIEQMKWVDRAVVKQYGLVDGALETFAIEAGVRDREPAPDEKMVELQRNLKVLREKLKGKRSRKLKGIQKRLRALADDVGAGDEAEMLSFEDSATSPDHNFGLGVEHELINLANDFYRLSTPDGFDRAIELYTLTLELKPDCLEGHFNRALAYTRRSRDLCAIDDLNTVIDLNPNLAEAFYTRGLVWEYTSDYDRAIMDYEKALDIDKDYTKAANQIEVARGKRAQVRTPPSPPDDTPPSDTAGAPRGNRDESKVDFDDCRKTSDFRFADVGGNREAVRELLKVRHYLLNDRNSLLDKFGCRPPRGVLLVGPPGTGKTLLAEALAGEVDCPFYVLSCHNLLNMYYGVTLTNVATLFREVRSHERCVLFMDEFDGIGSVREKEPDKYDCHGRTVTALLESFDGFDKHTTRLVIVAATNSLSRIDTAFLRPGRFDRIIEVPLPKAPEIAEILLIHLDALRRRATAEALFSPEIQQLLDGNRREHVDRAFEQAATDSVNWLVKLARNCARMKVAGAELAELTRSLAESCALYEIEKERERGPITPALIEAELATLRRRMKCCQPAA